MEHEDVAVREHRFWSKVDKTGDCWVWTGKRNGSGYGMFWVPPREERAHRVSILLRDGELDAEAVVLHLCDNPACVNPEHLEVGTQADNLRDCREKGRHAFGEQHGHAKLTDDQVMEIRRSSERQIDLARRFGVSKTTICNIRAGRLYTHLPHKRRVRKARLTPKQRAEIRRLYATGASAATLAEEYGVHPLTIRRTCHNS